MPHHEDDENYQNHAGLGSRSSGPPSDHVFTSLEDKNTEKPEETSLVRGLDNFLSRTLTHRHRGLLTQAIDVEENFTEVGTDKNDLQRTELLLDCIEEEDLTTFLESCVDVDIIWENIVACLGGIDLLEFLRV